MKIIHMSFDDSYKRDTKNGGHNRQLAVALRLILFRATKGRHMLFACQVA
jgi:hypothetical protein